MKKVILTALMTALCVSCQEKIYNEVILSKSNFTASPENFNDTKTTLNDNTDILWFQGDQLAIFQGSTLADKYQVTDVSVGKSNGIFEIVDNSGELNGDFSSGNEISTNIAVYPYMEGLSCTKANVKQTENGTEVSAYEVQNFSLPTIQNYVSNSFGNGTFPMVAVTGSMSDHSLKFKNVCGAIKLQLKGTDMVKSIKIEGKNGEKLSGAANITAYPDNSMPAITMSDNASTSVTLDCGEGVQLNETTVTNFIIALPPVLFTKGFVVTITNVDNGTKTIETDKANAVLRSSLLTMPVVKLTENSGTPEDDEETIPVLLIVFTKTSLVLPPERTYELTAEVVPSEATNKTITWSTSDATVATVDQNGVVMGITDGTVTVTATAGGVVSECSVTVISPAVASVDYIDEYGVNHGKGVVIGWHCWAPVNCGYHATEYPYGKHYQWGRKYGQGLGGDYDSHGPVIMEDPVTLDVGQNKGMQNYFISGNSDWISSKNNKLWNLGTETFPKKGDYDPCPDGWRVPTTKELKDLAADHSGFTQQSNVKGMSFYGTGYDISTDENQVFLPASGFRSSNGGSLSYVGGDGFCWSASPYSDYAYCLYFNSNGYVGPSDYYYRAGGYSVRCLQE